MNLDFHSIASSFPPIAVQHCTSEAAGAAHPGEALGKWKLSGAFQAEILSHPWAAGKGVVVAANKLCISFAFPAATCKCFSEVKWKTFLSNKISVFSFLFPCEKEINIPCGTNCDFSRSGNSHNRKNKGLLT